MPRVKAERQAAVRVADVAQTAHINGGGDTNGRLIGRGWVKFNPAKMANFQLGVDIRD